MGICLRSPKRFSLRPPAASGFLFSPVGDSSGSLDEHRDLEILGREALQLAGAALDGSNGLLLAVTSVTANVYAIPGDRFRTKSHFPVDQLACDLFWLRDRIFKLAFSAAVESL